MQIAAQPFDHTSYLLVKLTTWVCNDGCIYTYNFPSMIEVSVTIYLFILYLIFIIVVGIIMDIDDII